MGVAIGHARCGSGPLGEGRAGLTGPADDAAKLAGPLLAPTKLVEQFGRLGPCYPTYFSLLLPRGRKH